MPIIDMTQESSTPPSTFTKSPSQAQSSLNLSGRTLLDQINTQLELLSEICDTERKFPVVEPSHDSCYIISSDSDDDIQRFGKVGTITPPVEDLAENSSNTDEPETNNEELERTVIYFEQDKSFAKESEDEKNFVESLVDQTILDENSSDSIDVEELNETLDTFPSPAKPVDVEYKPEPGPFNDSFDEFDALVFGERKVPDPPLVLSAPVQVSSQVQTEASSRSTTQPTKKPLTLAQEFDRLSSLERKFAKKQEFKIKTRDVTPPPDYERMDDTKIEWEMKRLGLKYIKHRNHRVQMLNHIYARTHPFIEIRTENDQNMSLVLLSGKDDAMAPVESEPSQVDPILDENVVPVKKFMSLEEKYGLVDTKDSKRKGDVPSTLDVPVKKFKSSQKPAAKSTKSKPEATIALKDFADGDTNDLKLTDNDFYTSQFFHDTSDILAVKAKGKLQWCPMSLHIAFINVLRANPWLQLKVLQYEPLEIEVLYKYFKNIGARYELSDLKFFLDKYCITFRSEN